MAASFNAYRNTNRNNSVSDDTAKDLKNQIRESRWIQPEQWQSPEVQEKFQNVNIRFSRTQKTNSIFGFLSRVQLISRKYIACFSNWILKSRNLN